MANPQELSQEEIRQVTQGEALQSMRESQGWKVVEEWLRNRAHHSWADPRDFKKKEEWEWAELNAFHSANVAKQIIDDIEGAIADAEYLRKKERGEVEDNKFKEIFTKLAGGKK